jgi:catechol-2,3-dioxygenase
MKTYIRHFGITVNNMKTMLSFFLNDLGFKVLRRMNEKGDYIDSMLKLKNVKVTTVKIKDKNNQIIELLKFKNYKSTRKWQGKIFTTGPTHIALTVKNIEQTYKILKKKYHFNAIPQLSPDKLAKVTFFQGPENLHVEIVEVLK